MDTGLIKSLRHLGDREWGALLETAVFTKLYSLGRELVYYKGRKECDFVIGEKIAIQVAYDISDEETLKREIAGLKEACNRFGLSKGLIVTFDTEDTLDLHSIKVRIIPATKFMLKEKLN